jgi:hypothetical protein
MKPL